MGQCETCAFNKPGSGGASDEPYNRLRGLISAHGLIPFFCHHAKNGAEYEWPAKTIRSDRCACLITKGKFAPAGKRWSEN
jgi:hypothetical protein